MICFLCKPYFIVKQVILLLIFVMIAIHMCIYNQSYSDTNMHVGFCILTYCFYQIIWVIMLFNWNLGLRILVIIIIMFIKLVSIVIFFSGGDGNYILSTSFLGFTPATGLVVPMCANGYGFFYSIIDNQ